MSYKIDATVVVNRRINGSVIAPASSADVEQLKAQLQSFIDSLQEVTIDVDDDGNVIVTGNAVVQNVSSVNNKTGAVILTYTDVGAAAEDHTHTAADITEGLAAVATSGNYNDLSNKPSIPTVTNDFTDAYKTKVDNATVKLGYMSTEDWTFTLDTGETVTKKVVVSSV